MATFSFSALQLGWIAKSEGHSVAVAVLLSTVPLQFLVSALAFHVRDTAAGTAMGLLAGTWAAITLNTLMAKPGATTDGLGIFLLAAGTSLFVPAVTATPRPWPMAVISLSALRFLLTGVAQLDGGSFWLHVAGWVGLVLAVLSFLAAFVLAFQRQQSDASAPGPHDEPGVRQGA